MKKIYTVTFNDISISCGPNIHYFELWNAFDILSQNEYQVIGLSGKWINKEPAAKLNFPLKQFRVPNIPMVRQILLDFYFSYYIIKHRKEIFYFRLSNYSFFVWLALLIFKVSFIVELNGIMKMDTKLFNKGKLYTFFSAFQERIFIRNSKGCIAVTNQIEKFAKDQHAKLTITIPNGVSSSFFAIPQKEKIGCDFVFVGSFTTWDGAFLIIDLAKNFKEATFHLIGDGFSRKEIERAKTENMKFYGNIPYAELINLYPIFDGGIALYSTPNNYMQLSSLKTLEYIASGLPVFTSNSLGQEFIEEKELGVCSQFENMASDFSIFMKKLNVYKMNVENFRVTNKSDLTWEKVALETERFIRNCV
jgi:glycosyltransferase involved in cell wall biosynthesis